MNAKLFAIVAFNFLATLQSCLGAFQVIYDDTLGLPPGVTGQDLLDDENFRMHVRETIAKTINLVEGQTAPQDRWGHGAGHFDPQPNDIMVTAVQVLEDTNAQATNAHGGIVHGKKRIRITAVLYEKTVLLKLALEKLSEIPLAGNSPWRVLRISPMPT